VTTPSTNQIHLIPGESWIPGIQATVTMQVTEPLRGSRDFFHGPAYSCSAGAEISPPQLGWVILTWVKVQNRMSVTTPIQWSEIKTSS